MGGSRDVGKCIARHHYSSPGSSHVRLTRCADPDASDLTLKARLWNRSVRHSMPLEERLTGSVRSTCQGPHRLRLQFLLIFDCRSALIMPLTIYSMIFGFPCRQNPPPPHSETYNRGPAECCGTLFQPFNSPHLSTTNISSYARCVADSEAREPSLT